jgi:type IV pilus assembly protein PilC
MKNNKKHFRPAYLSSFCMELALIIKSGISLEDGLHILYEDEKNTQSKMLLQTLYEKISDQVPFYTALSDDGRFPQYFIDMIELGILTGRLDEILSGLSEYYDNQQRINVHVKNAVIYPVILLIIMLIVIILLITQVLPLFNNVFSQLNGSLSPLAQALLSFGSSIENYMLLIIIFFIAICILIAILLYNAKKTHTVSKRLFDRIFSNRNLPVSLATAKFADALSICMQNGIDIDQSLDMAKKINTNQLLDKKITACQALIAQGMAAPDAFIGSSLFSGLFSRMLAVGYQTGNADIVMCELARKLEQQAAEKLNDAISRIEPTLVIILSVIVGILLLSVMLPLMSIMSVIG